VWEYSSRRVLDNFYIPLLNHYLYEGLNGGVSLLRYKYTLTNDGERRVSKDEFYLQETPKYRGYTEKIFRALYSSDPLTIAEISYNTGINKRSVNGVITFNLMAGYIQRILL
jgi:hypothetical protein